MTYQALRHLRAAPQRRPLSAKRECVAAHGGRSHTHRWHWGAVLVIVLPGARMPTLPVLADSLWGWDSIWSWPLQDLAICVELYT